MNNTFDQLESALTISNTKNKSLCTPVVLPIANSFVKTWSTPGAANARPKDLAPVPDGSFLRRILIVYSQHVTSRHSEEKRRCATKRSVVFPLLGLEHYLTLLEKQGAGDGEMNHTCTCSDTNSTRLESWTGKWDYLQEHSFLLPRASFCHSITSVRIQRNVWLWD